MAKRDEFLKAVDGLREDFNALDRKMLRLQEQVTALAYEVETLRRQQQPAPIKEQIEKLITNIDRVGEHYSSINWLAPVSAESVNCIYRDITTVLSELRAALGAIA